VLDVHSLVVKPVKLITVWPPAVRALFMYADSRLVSTKSEFSNSRTGSDGGVEGDGGRGDGGGISGGGGSGKGGGGGGGGAG